MPLGWLPYTAAFAVWVLTTLALLGAVLWRIGGHTALLLGFALPPILANAMVGQNGFLTAALFAAALLALPRKAWLAALLITLITYKPQFGILIPVALVASAAILYAVIYLAHGVNLRTSAALLGTLSSLLLAAGLS